MANRSYLYTYHPDDPNPYRDLSEWKSNPPLSHYLLVSSDPTPVKTQLWSVEEKIAIQAEASGGRDIFLRFLDWIEPQVPSASADIKTSKAALSREDRQGEFFHLELGEIYELSGYDLSEMENACSRDASSALAVGEEVRNLLETQGSSMQDFKAYELKELQRDWERSSGLYFPGILYFHMGK